MAKHIYVITLSFDHEVYVPGVGFTRIHLAYARGGSGDEASRRASQHYKDKYSLTIERATAALARKQGDKRYAFPEQSI